MLQINANPNQDSIIVHSIYRKRIYLTQPLNSNKLDRFDVPIVGFFDDIFIFALNNGLVFVMISNDSSNYQLLVFNPITKECNELPQLPNILLWTYYNVAFDFFEHDLQSSTYKIFLINSRGYIYKSSSHIWQSLNSLYNIKSNLQLKYISPYNTKFVKLRLFIVSV